MPTGPDRAAQADLLRSGGDGGGGAGKIRDCVVSIAMQDEVAAVDTGRLAATAIAAAAHAY